MFTTIYAVHKFSDDTDYFLIDQTITGNNRTFWMGEWTKKNYKAYFDGGKHNWRIQGFYANDWEVNNRMATRNDRVKAEDGLVLVQHAPASTNGSTTTSTSTSWSLGGDLGNCGGTITGGISGSVGSSQTILDISTVDMCMNDNTGNTGNNARWKYTIDPLRQAKAGTFTYSFVEPPSAAIETFSCEQSWLWELKNASRYEKLYLNTMFSLLLYRTLIRNPFLGYAQIEMAGSRGAHIIEINLPKRTK